VTRVADLITSANDRRKILEITLETIKELTDEYVHRSMLPEPPPLRTLIQQTVTKESICPEDTPAPVTDVSNQEEASRVTSTPPLVQDEPQSRSPFGLPHFFSDDQVTGDDCQQELIPLTKYYSLSMEAGFSCDPAIDEWQSHSNGLFGLSLETIQNRDDVTW
jgi:hypothetical protein